MKKLVLMAAIALSIASASAQIFMGGSVGVNFGSSDFGTNIRGISGKNYNKFALNMSPKAGYIINDKLSTGLQLKFASFGDNITNLANAKEKTSASEFGLAPFVRYDALTFGKVKLGLEALLAVSSASSKTKTAGVEANSIISTFELGVVPVLSYSLTEKFNLEAYLDFAEFGFASQTTKPNQGASISSTSFGFGVNADEAFTTGNLNIGFVYKF
jgi:long-subunit fatty acid transport protein